ncbi:MAG: MBL fold metallo-hydrolase [Dehalococcoidales bacterium]|nr:MBL fold metallo-hydrolase [Dehalococcoidales bacterium]
MKLKITTLSENTASALGILAEWGLSVLVETGDTAILLDTGQSVSVPHNARVLRVDLSKVSKILLSHGHIDHTGGLLPVLKLVKPDVQIIAHPDVLDAKYSGRYEENRHYIGIPPWSQELQKLGARFNLTKESVQLADNIITTGEVPLVTDFEQVDPNRFYVKSDSTWQDDNLLDDQAIIINHEPGLIVILGCAHRGMINTIYHAQKLTGRKEIQMVIGGCHLIWSDASRIYKTIDALKVLDVQKVGVSHCTGMEASAMMAQALGDSFFFNNAGDIISIDGAKIEVS